MHSFIDIADSSALPVQPTGEKYGPVPGSESTQFRVTARFQSTNSARAFAVVDGQIIVQEQSGDSALVNIVLKPFSAPQIGFTPVKYFIYRGIKKDTLITGTSPNEVLRAYNLVNNELNRKIWDEHEGRKKKASPEVLADPAPGSIGYDNSLPGTTKLDDIFANKFDARPSTLLPEGMWIGNFVATTGGTMIGFEIVLDEGNTSFDLNYVRAASYTVTVPSAIDTFANRLKREEILKFIDPAAYYGLHFSTGVNYAPASGPNKMELLEGKDIYDKLIKIFNTRNRVYIDIRNDIGLSYNFYRNYVGTAPDADKQIQLQRRDDASPISRTYDESGWPLIYVEGAQSAGSAMNDVSIFLRLGDNPLPQLFLASARHSIGTAVTPDATRFITNRKLFAAGSEWTKKQTFTFPNVVNGSTLDNIASYIQLYFFRRRDNSTVYKTGVLQNKVLLDNAFGPIDVPQLVAADDAFKMVYYHDLKYIDGNLPGASFGFVVDRGVVYDDDKVVLYVKNSIPFETPDLLTGKTASPSSVGLPINNPFFDLSFLGGELRLSYDQLEIGPTGGPYTSVRTVTILDSGSITDSVENLFLLCITKQQFDSLRTTAGFYMQGSEYPHPRFIRLTHKAGPNVDKNGKAYSEYTLDVHGLSNDTLPVDTVAGPSGAGTPIVVYTQDSLVFTSTAFSSGITLPEGYTRNYEERFGVELKQDDREVAIAGTGTNLFTINGRDVTHELLPGETFEVTGSDAPANNRTFTVVATSYDNGVSEVQVSETVTAVTTKAKGNILYHRITWEDYFINKDQLGTLSGTNRMQTIVDAFTAAVAAVASNSNAEQNLGSLVTTYAPMILNRARALANAQGGAGYRNLDDRILYWARIKMEVALKSHPLLMKSDTASDTLIKKFEVLSRGYDAINFSAYPLLKKILVVGFDPAYLNRNIEYGNPSGAVALAIHGELIKNSSNASIAYVQSMVIPVRYRDFDGSADRTSGEGKGIIEQYIGPFINNPSQRVDMIVSVSMDVDSVFRLDRFATRARGGEADNVRYVRRENSPAIAAEDKYNWIETTLPLEFVPEHSYTSPYPASDPVNDPNPDSNGDWVLFNQGFTKEMTERTKIFRGDDGEPDATSNDSTDYGRALNGPSSPVLMKMSKRVPVPGERMYVGSGGNFLSNEVFYRIALMRELIKDGSGNPKMATGHLHIPDAQRNPQPHFDAATRLRIVKKAIQRIVLGTRALP